MRRWLCGVLVVGCGAPTAPPPVQDAGCWVHIAVVGAGVRQPVALHYAHCPPADTLAAYFPGGYTVTP